MELWYTAGKTFAMLCLVLGALLAFLYALKRLTQKGGIDQCQIKLISSFSIAPRKQIMILDVMHERMVLGVTAEHISCISKYPITAVEEVNKALTTEDQLHSENAAERRDKNKLTENYSLRKFNKNPNMISQVQSEK
jgi:flagellar biosynthetic protein FliO